MSNFLKIITVGRNPKVTFVRALILGISLVTLFRYFLIPIRVRGISMEPAYHDGSVNLVNALSFRTNDPARGDVVAIRLAGMQVMLLKRIIALPGETVAFEDGVLIIDGRKMPEPYLKNAYEWTMKEVKNDSDEYFVAGDNRSMPISLHTMGRVKRDRIVGPVMFDDIRKLSLTGKRR
jgi:signal peptidase I